MHLSSRARAEYVVTACRHSYSEEDAKQLRQGDEPEQDRSNKRRRLLHLSALPSVAVLLDAPRDVCFGRGWPRSSSQVGGFICPSATHPCTLLPHVPKVQS